MSDSGNIYRKRGGRGAAILSEKHDTDSGMTAPQARAVTAYEAKIYARKTERVAAIGNDGRILGQSEKGTSNRTALPYGNYKDAVITHNHPQQIKKGVNYFGKGMAGVIGNTFSGADVAAAIRNDAKEIRVVSAGYVFSLRRPKGGWGADASTIRTAIDSGFKRKMFRYYPDIDVAGAKARRTGAQSDMDNAYRKQGNANVAASHANMKEFAKKYGWIYTRRPYKS